MGHKKTEKGHVSRDLLQEKVLQVSKKKKKKEGFLLIHHSTQDCNLRPLEHNSNPRVGNIVACQQAHNHTR